MAHFRVYDVMRRPVFRIRQTIADGGTKLSNCQEKKICVMHMFLYVQEEQ